MMLSVNVLTYLCFSNSCLHQNILPLSDFWTTDYYMWQLLLQTRAFNINFGVEMECDALRNLVRFVKIKSCKKHPARSVFYGFKLYNWYQDMQSITNIKEFLKTGLSHHTQEMYEVVIKEVLFFSWKNEFWIFEETDLRK